jgi:polysaccharide biosynthesis/export protein
MLKTIIGFSPDRPAVPEGGVGYGRRVLRVGRPVLLTVVSLLAASVAAGAQVVAGAQQEREEAPSLLAPPVNALLLDTPIQRSEYIVGPGDVLVASIFGNAPRNDTLTVSPEGTLMIPNVGVVSVMGQNLDEAEQRVRSQVYRFFRGVDVRLHLAQARQFKVFVVGDTPEPGVRAASSVMRVSEVVPSVTNYGMVPRNLALRRANGDSVMVDLARFQLLGDLSMNPTLREGDTVILRAVDETVHVLGRVRFPAIYNYREGETLADLLHIANGGDEFLSNAADTIRVSRFIGPEQRETRVFSRAEAAGAAGQALVLQPFDAVFVPEIANYKEIRSVRAEGQVARPGAYPIDPGVTTVRDLVRMAGGFTSDASLLDATLHRSVGNATNYGLEQLLKIPPELLTSAEVRILSAHSQTDASRVVINFQRLFEAGHDGFDQPLREGDILNVPRQRQEVAIVGAVLRPGLVHHTPGIRVQDVVTLAGGYARRADRAEAVVLKAESGARLSLSDAGALQPGDVVIVPFRERRDWLAAFQTTSAIVTSFTGLILTYIAIFGT